MQVAGSLAHLGGRLAVFQDDLTEQLALSNKRMNRALDRIDAHIATQGVALRQAIRPQPFALPRAAPALKFSKNGISNVLWATGYRSELSFLKVGGRDPGGEPLHEGGVCAVPGLYLLGMNFMRQRSSSTIAGTVRDARVLANIIARQREKETSHAA